MKGTFTEMQERRKHKRVTVSLKGRLAAGTKVLDVTVKDVSARGALVVASEHPPHGVPLTLRIDKLGEFDCEQKWQLRRSRLKSSDIVLIGLGFSEAHEDIYEVLDRLSAE